jgi:geranylgeranyl diphosphate synthase type I
MMRYHLGWEDQQGNPSDATGKRLRPALCLLACEAAGGEWQKALPAAAAVELVHSFSLVHDDIQDRDRERHHRPAVWTVWGEAQAINAGDALLALARLALTTPAEDGIPPETIVDAGRLLDAATLDMVEGQTLDLEYEQRPELSLDDYTHMAEKKSGALFGCALALGALAAGKDGEASRRFDRAGRRLGLAFQARDDILAIWGKQEKTGKPSGSDILRKKKSLPYMLAYGLADPKACAKLSEAYAVGDVGNALAVFDTLDVRSACESRVAGLRANAFESLDALELDPDTAAELRIAAEFLIDRDF